jgi:hypothetical protein
VDRNGPNVAAYMLAIPLFVTETLLSILGPVAHCPD